MSSNTHTQQVLKKALKMGSLCGLHIDLQNRYREALTQQAFSNAIQIAKILRNIRVPNFWAAFTQAVNTPTTYGEYNCNMWVCNQDKMVAGIPENDVILPKRRASLIDKEPDTKNYDAFNYLTQTAKKDTFLITGVYASACVFETIREAFHASAHRKTPIKIIVVKDAIDTSMSINDMSLKVKRSVTGLPPQSLLFIKHKELEKLFTPTSLA